MIESVLGVRVPGAATRRRDVKNVCGLVGTAALFLSIHLARGPNFVLDDWWVVAEGHFDGIFGATDTALGQARPGTVPAYGLTFGLFKNHPLPIFLELAVVYLFVVVALYAALRRFVGPRAAVLAAGIWILLPNHQTLEVWATAIIISLSLLCVLLGIWVVAVPEPTRLHQATALGLFVAASLFYEASIVVCSALIVVVPLLIERRFRFGFIAAGVATQGAVALWLLTHWHSVKHAQPFPDLGLVLPAHFGWGIAYGRVGDVLEVIALVGIAAALLRVTFPSFRQGAGEPEHLVLAGLAIIIVGTLPWLRYFYVPWGMGDRVLYISGIGGALVWAGIALMLWRYRPLLVAGAAFLVFGALWARWESAEVWDKAGNDGVAILQLMEDTIEQPADPIAVGPGPIVEGGVAAYLDSSNIDRAAEVLYDDRAVVAFMTFTDDHFASEPEASRVDIREVSTLDPDFEWQLTTP